MSGILYHFALVLTGIAVALLLPVAVAASYGETVALVDFGLTAALTSVVSVSAAIALTGRERRLVHKNGYILLIMVWALVPAIAAIPVVLITGLAPIDAYFETVSGLTTTGATVFKTLDPLPRAVIFWRAELQWIGGFLTLLSIVLILAPAGVGGLPGRQIRLLETSERTDISRATQIVLDTATAYGAATFICFVGLFVIGAPAFDAFCLTFSTVSTGGFMPRDGDLSVYGLPALEVWLAVFMVIGATSILWHRMVLQRRFQLLKEHRESYILIAGILVLGVLTAAVLFQAAGSASVLSPLSALREGLVTAASMISTTGYETRTGGLALLPLPLVLMVIFIGGSAFSTAGGIKAYRFGAMATQSARELTRLLYPHGIRPAKFGSQPYDMQLMKAIWSHFVVTVMVLGIITLVVAGEAIDYENALLATAATFSNIGPVYESQWQTGVRHWQLFEEFGVIAKLALCLTMIAGRLEMLALLGAVNGLIWLRR
ncbi:TrkH family potassium uptake protein [Rhodobium gokarnense]|uniref:Trk system potassium uptake protein TrkH n=1 Tax=Rhodobium gokarnense TaxID=364296 RepID=A0ABT3HB07_9HYPH|nr:potassium transporter TrkG [Rhodobium gokarnense]MCW2307581.1 trk system potassium uptake protein TrkH [Rhodobium gokarnense]